MKKLAWFLMPIALLSGASFIKLSQIRGSIGNPTLLFSPGDGTVKQLALGPNLVISNGIISVVNPPGTLAPAISVTHIQSNTINSFPIPSGRTVCIVTRGISQSLNEDYTIISGAIVFNSAPEVDDIVQLTCF